jgi:processive 1,2-diacylglycerol beta-glucosyltransferase
VATHFYPLAVLRGRVHVPIVGVVTDYAAHAVWAEPGIDAYCVAPGPAKEQLVRHGVPRERIRTTGIPVRGAFGRVSPVTHRSDSPLRVLVTSGAFGVGPVGRVLCSFARVRDVELTIVCGDNAALERRVRALCATCAPSARVIGFEPDMPSRFAEADVVVGKPGGLTASECLAAGRPLVMVGAVPGQETRNQEFLEQADAAIALRPEQVGPTLAALRAVGALEPMARRARQIGRPWAADRVLETALDCAA